MSLWTCENPACKGHIIVTAVQDELSAQRHWDAWAALSKPLLPWQQWAVKHALELNPDGT